VEEESKPEDVRVSMVTPVVKHALDHRSKHELVVLQSLTLGGQDMEVGVLAL